VSLSRVAMLVGTLAVLLQGGCGKESTRPAVTDVGLAVAAKPHVGGPRAPVTVHALARNTGNARVWHCRGCGCGNGMSIRILGPDGREVALQDPKTLRVGDCPDFLNEPLDPAETLEAGARFTGVLYERDSPAYPSPTYPAPSGTYTVVATIGYKSSVSGETITLTSRTTFVWAP
jgi:hypothetical protein